MASPQIVGSGLTLLGRVTVLSIVLIVVAVFLERVLFYQELAEKTAVDLIVTNMRTGLRYRAAELRLEQKEGEIINLVGGNAIQWLDRPVPNYAGEFDHPQEEQIPPGSWYFETGTGEVRYRIKRRQHFSSMSHRTELRFRVDATSRVGSGAGNDGRPTVRGIGLHLLEDYEWFDSRRADASPGADGTYPALILEAPAELR